jgi:Protein of unknown function (DUF669)
MSKYEFNGLSALPETFDPSQQEGSSFNPIPAGEYTLEIIEASVNEARNGNGDRLNLTCKVIEGEHENRYVWHGITLTNSSTQAVEIGRKQLKDLCVACAITDPVTDAEVFKFKPFLARVVIRVDKDGVYADQNKIARVLPLPDVIPPAPKAKSYSDRRNGDAPF